MPFTHAIVSTESSVRFAETDLMGVVHHAAYVVWMEVGRVAWMSQAGMPYTEIAAGGNHFAVTGIDVKYRAAVCFGDTIRIDTQVIALRSRQVSFVYEMFNAGTGELAATGRSDHICVDLDGRMAKIPAHVIERLTTGAERMSRGPGIG